MQKPLSLITAAAQVYSSQLMFDGARFNQILETNTQLKEIIFNATELQKGLGFRFQKTQSNRSKSGNKYFPIQNEFLGSIRLADMVAASSCFPGGFEPLKFPQDFDWPTGKYNLSKVEELFPQTVALMDGGLYDNQGVEALLLAGERKSVKIGTLIISDTDNIQPQQTLFEFPSPHFPSFLSLKMINIIAKVLFFGSLFSVIALIFNTIELFFTSGIQWTILIYVFAIIPIVGVIIAFLWIRNIVKDFKSLLEDIGINPQELWKTLAPLKISQAKDLGEVRLKSILALSSVFLRRTRSLIYNKVYETKSGKYKDIVITNFIYDFYDDSLETESQVGIMTSVPDDFEISSITQEDNMSVPIDLTPSLEMKKLATKVTQFPTTLWFDKGKEEQQLKDLIACGHFTICFNLLKKFEKVSTGSPLIESVNEQAEEAWNNFQQNPYFLINRNRELTS
ncbi:hypothetical protein PCC7424_0547 [Gloeothece citriformis PCC 7424]|uniref:PNPLA domain-containing protein n=1 Tax=Gloeothece citriformis (strain PCC 7424) TaxID=65393 RepID=B7KDJ0_GLOC7|nr:patatin-like phospholipase family protein [Gloeothece citriformis]ACK69010.1 hypothetical protein PCC7424_0547 [Gloeothece citriformis PCC 7424]